MTELCGRVAPGYDAVADAFLANFADGGETGAACTVYVDGTEVVNVWAGTADVTTGRPWDDKSVAMVYSTTKGVAAICAHLLVQRGLLDLDRPVADYWPEFAAGGKEDVPVRLLLSHQVGLPVFDAVLRVDQVLGGVAPVSALAEQKPVWEPGTRHGYHALTYGWLVGELVRRVSGRSLGAFLTEEIAAPLGLSTWIGLPDSEHHRVVRLVHPEAPSADAAPAVAADVPAPVVAMMAAFADPTSVTSRAFTLNGALVPGEEEAHPELDPDYLHSEMASVNGISDAASLAKLYAACVSEVDGFRLLDDDTVARAAAEQANGPDEVLFLPIRWGLGFMLASPTSPYLGPSSFGHPGSGGSVGFADRDAKVGFGYVMNKMGASVMSDVRKRVITDALRRVLG